MRAASAALMTIAFAACAPRAGRSVMRSDQPPSADSLTLERTRCFGSCPAYRITVTRSGRINYETRQPRDTMGTVVSSTATSTLPYLVARAMRVGFFALPREIAKDPELCPRIATDMPSAVVTIFTQDSAKTVIDYHGCFVGTDLSMPTRLAKLRDFEAEIDSVLGTARFIKRVPAR